jgi:hypothetical protein
MVDEENVMKIDDYDFDQTAQAVFIMNPTAKERYETWEDLKSFMVSMAYTYGHNTNSFSTGGFQLTFFPSSGEDEIAVRASVSSYTAFQYINRVKRIVELAKQLENS